MLRKLKLYGELAKFVGHKEFEIQVDSLAKAVSFLVNNFPQVEKYMNPQYYQVKVGNYLIDQEEIHYPIGQEDIHIVPVISGAGRGGLGKVLLGAALIGIAFANPKPVLIRFERASPCGTKKAPAINAAPNNTFPKPPLPAPLITGTICISSCPIG